MELASALVADWDWVLVELYSGGFGALPSKSLEGAKAVSAKRYFTDEQRRSLKRGMLDLSLFQTGEDEENGVDEDDGA